MLMHKVRHVYEQGEEVVLIKLVLQEVVLIQIRTQPRSRTRPNSKFVLSQEVDSSKFVPVLTKKSYSSKFVLSQNRLNSY